MFLPDSVLEEKLRQILTEDLGQGDLTTQLTVPADTNAEAEVIAKDEGIVAGIEEATILLKSLGLRSDALARDGEKIKRKQVLIRISGNARTILSAERTVLNVLSRMSGIATITRKLSEKLTGSGLKTRVACTRKTAPGMLYFDKKAVLIGGGDTHRLHLDDMILIKDNHISIVGGMEKAVEKARNNASFTKKIEVEVTKPKDVLVAAKAKVDVIMLDNFSPQQIKQACRLLEDAGFRNKVLLEASGRITEENILEYASTGIDIVSLGELTQNAKAIDISLEIVRVSSERDKL